MLAGDPDAIARLDDAVRLRALDDSLVRVKIWTLTSTFMKVGVLDRTQAALWAERNAPDRSGVGIA